MVFPRYLQPPPVHCIPLSQHEAGWTCWKVENPGVGITQLLVAAGVLIRREVCFHLWPVPPDESPPAPPVGELYPLPIPDTPWDTISIDFIVELLDSEGHDTVMVVVDSVTKQAHFMPTFTTITTARTAWLFIQQVWKHHGLRQKVVSNHGPQFVAEFTRELYRMLRIKLAATTAYYLQWDRQMEHVNQELKQYLHLFVNQWQDDWTDLLLLAKFQYNNHIHSSTHHLPFLLESRCLPCMGFEPDQHPSWVELVNEFMEWMKSTLEEAKSALAKSKDDMARYYDQRHMPAPEYQPRDKVYLDTSDVSTTHLSKKLSHQRLGFFPVERKVGNGAYCLHLPAAIKHVHPVFNVVKLTLAPEDPIVGRHAPPPPLPEIVDGEEELGGQGNLRQQGDQPENLLPCEMEGLQSQAQLMGTLGQHACTRSGSGLLPQTPRSSSTHSSGGLFLPSVSINLSIRTTPPWGGGGGGVDVRGHWISNPVQVCSTPWTPLYIPPHQHGHQDSDPAWTLPVLNGPTTPEWPPGLALFLFDFSYDFLIIRPLYYLLFLLSPYLGL